MSYTKEQRLINQAMGTTKGSKKIKTTSQETRTPIGSDMFLPNLSGISSHPEFKSYLDDTYLRLDCSNDPLTGNLVIKSGANDPLDLERNKQTAASGRVASFDFLSGGNAGSYTDWGRLQLSGHKQGQGSTTASFYCDDGSRMNVDSTFKPPKSNPDSITLGNSNSIWNTIFVDKVTPATILTVDGGIYTDQTSLATKNVWQQDWSISSGSASNTLAALYMDLDFNAESGSALFPTLSPFKMDIDITDAGAVFFMPTMNVMDIDINIPSTMLTTNTKFFKFNANRVLDQAINFAASGTGAASTGLMYVQSSTSDASANTALRSDALITNTSNSVDAIGYQCVARNADTGNNGRAIAIKGSVWTSPSTKANIILTGSTISTGNNKNRSFILHNANFGHLLMDRGGLCVTSTQRDELATVNPATHVANWNTTTANGFGYFEEALEVDGIIYSDGGITMADSQNIVLQTTNGTKIGTATNQKLGFFNKTPVVQQTGCAVPTDLATCITAITVLRTALNNLGLTTIV